MITSEPPCIHCDRSAYRPDSYDGRRSARRCSGCNRTTAYCLCERADVTHVVTLECSECHVRVPVDDWEQHTCPPAPERWPLIWALHLIRHEHGDLWKPEASCGCAEWADSIIENWP